MSSPESSTEASSALLSSSSEDDEDNGIDGHAKLDSSSSSSDSDAEHPSEEDTDPDEDPDGDIEFGSDVDDPWVRDAIRGKRRSERAKKREARLEKKERKREMRKVKLGIVQDQRPGDVPMREKLRELYTSLGGSIWTNTLGWDGKVERLSLFYGCVVNRDTDDGPNDPEPVRLLSLSLPRNGLVGDFRRDFKPHFRSLLKDLRVLNLSHNELPTKKGLPMQISSCVSLTTLLLEGIGIGNELPDEGFRLPNLQVLSLKTNKLKGSPEPAFMCSPKLRVLDLSENKFEGTIEKEWISNIAGSIEKLDLSYNRLGGAILTPDFCSHLGPTLLSLSLAGNQFVGSIPLEFGMHFKLLQVMHLDANEFGGVIPPSFFEGLKSIRRLWIEKNRLLGDARLFDKLTSLRSLVIGENHFGEEMPYFPNLSFLRVLRMNNCRFAGNVPLEHIQRMKCLQEFSVAGCRFMNQRSVQTAMKWAQDTGLRIGRA